MSHPLPATPMDRFAARVTARRGAWLTILIALVAAFALGGALRTDAEPGRGAEIPASAESAIAAARHAELPDAGAAPLLTVFSRDDGQALTAQDNAAIDAAGARIAAAIAATDTGVGAAAASDASDAAGAAGAARPSSGTADAAAPAAPHAIASEDGRAAIVTVPLPETAPGTDETAAAEQAEAQVDAARAAAQAELPQGLQAQVTGGPAFGVDVAGAFSGANWLLLGVTIAIVAILLLITYRSPLLMLLPLAVVGVADQLAAAVTKYAGVRFGFGFDAGIVSVLVFGAGTNYALLMISRYREELSGAVVAARAGAARPAEATGRAADTAAGPVELPRGWHRAPLARAAAATWPAILASNITVVLALATLLAVAVPASRGIGIAAAIGLALTLLLVGPLLPAVLAVAGPGAFWPRNPARHPEAAQQRLQHRGLWGRIGTVVTKRPARVLVAGVLALVVAATGLLGTGLGLSQTDRFRVPSESAAGLETIAAHFPAGAATPLTVVAPAADADAVRSAIATVPGVLLIDGRPADTAGPGAAGSPAAPADPGSAGPGAPAGSPESGTAGRISISVTGAAAPATAEAFDQVNAVRDAVHAASPDAVVGGPDAEALDARAAAVRDLLVALPLILAVVAIVVGALLRSWAVALVVMVVDIVSALAALGLGTAIGRWVFGFPALDTNVPLLAVLFLVALGVDYSLFLAHRVKQELAAGSGAAGTGEVAAAGPGQAGEAGAAATAASGAPATTAASGDTRAAVTRALSATGGVITSAGVVLAAVFAALGVLPLVTLLQIGVIVCVGVLIDTLLVRTVIMPAVFALLPRRAWGPLPAAPAGTAGTAPSDSTPSGSTPTAATGIAVDAGADSSAYAVAR